MSVLEMIKARHSVRKYQALPVEEDKLAKILEAGRLAPSAANRQRWKFIVVREKETRRRLSVACHNQKFVAEAPISIVACATEINMMPCEQPAEVIDCSIALTCMMLEASELGLGSCWLGAYHADQVKELLALPENYSVVAVMPVGYEAHDAPVTRMPRNPMMDFVVYKD